MLLRSRLKTDQSINDQLISNLNIIFLPSGISSRLFSGLLKYSWKECFKTIASWVPTASDHDLLPYYDH